MATGGGTPCYFNNIDFMNKSGTAVWINTPIDLLHERLLKDKADRPLIKNLDDMQLKGLSLKNSPTEKIYYEQAEMVVEEDEKSLEKIVGKIISCIKIYYHRRIAWRYCSGAWRFWCSWFKKIVPAETVQTFQTGVQYQMYHALALLLTGLLV